jgi:RNA polymerase sigma-70 factor (ECF subfamily)
MDKALVVRAQRGDEVAFAAITQATSGRFKQVSYRILRDRHLAEDATQTALVEIWRTLPKLRDPARFDGWAYRVLVHACYREAKRYQRSFGIEPGRQELASPDHLGAVNDRDQIERGFAWLSVDQRAVVVLHYFADLTIDDTARALGISPGTAKSRLSRAMKRMRTTLEADSAAAPGPADLEPTS